MKQMVSETCTTFHFHYLISFVTLGAEWQAPDPQSEGDEEADGGEI